MKISEVKLKSKVFDTYYYHLTGRELSGVGVVVKKLKTRIHIKFKTGVASYDFAHVRSFIEKFTKSNVKKKAL